MKKTTRKITMATVLLCGGLLAGVGLGDMDSATAYAAEADKFFEVKSVALRVPDDNYGEGIRFTIVMDTDTYTEENVANLTTGVLLIPNYALGSDELVVDYDNDAMMKVEGVSWTADEGVMKMYVHLYNIPDTEYATEISIRAYVDDGDVTTVPLYTDVAVSSVANVADWLYRNDDLTDEEKATLQETYLTYDVFFHNGTDVTATKGIYGEKISAPTIDEMEGYTFGGWWNQAETAQWDFDNTTIGGVETNLYAKWDINTYSAKVVRADGTEETVEFTVENREEKLAAIALTANDAQYTYAWATALPSELALNNDQVFTETRTVNNYIITFNTDGGSAVEAQTVPYGTPASALALLTTTKTGYNFVGWTFEDGTAIPENATVQSNLTVKANWEAQKFAITFVNENGDVLQSEQVAYNTVPTCAVTPVKDSDTYYDYIFAGWTPAVSAVTGEATYTATFTREIKAELRQNHYTLTELGGGEGIMGMWGNQVLTMKDSMEGTFIYKMTKVGVAGNQIHSFNLFYNGADAGSGVRITFTINGGITINGTPCGMANVIPNVEYYYLMSWKVADDYSKVTVRIRVEATGATAIEGTPILGDFTVDLTALGGAESIESYVTANNKILIDAQQCDFSVANAWTADDAAKFVTVKSLNDSIATLTGNETLDELNELKATYEAMDRVYQLMIKDYAALEEAIAKAKEAEEAAVAAIRDNTYTLTELGGGEGIMGMWGNQVLTMKDSMEGTFIYKMTKGGVVGNQIHSFNLFYDGANAGNGVRITFAINGGITINGMPYAMANVQPSVEYYYLISWKVADDYSKVTMRIRVESTDGTTVLGDFTVELASLIGADSIESWVNTNNKILIDAQQCDFSVANAWTELNSATLETVLDLETAIAALTGAESAETLNALKAQYDALDKVYQLMVDNYATLEAMLA